MMVHIRMSGMTEKIAKKFVNIVMKMGVVGRTKNVNIKVTMKCFVGCQKVDEKGERMSRILENEVHEIIDAAYQHGYKDGKCSYAKDIEEAWQKGLSLSVKIDEVKQYEKGLEDAWECARKMYQFNPANNRQLCEELYDMGFNEFICNTTAQEAIQKIKDYERKKKWSEQAKRGKKRRDKIKKMLNKKQKVFCQKQIKKESE